MDFLLIELILWGGLLFLFWALKDGLEQVESDIKSSRVPTKLDGHSEYALPEAVSDRIGTYRDKPIFRYAIIKGRDYQYDRIRFVDDHSRLKENECCVEPGLVYVKCDV